jgi:DNA-binding transcriptional LysR family regulator
MEARYLNGSRGEQASPLRVGGTYVLSSSILPSPVAVFKKCHPKVEVVLRSNAAGTLEQMILKGPLEIALSSLLPRSPELTAESFVPLKIVAFAARGYRLCRNQLSLADLQKIPLIIRDDGAKRGTTETLLLKLRNEGYRPNIIMRCDSPEAIKSAVVKKLGVGFLYKDAVKEGLLASGLFKKLCIPDLPMYGNSYIIYYKQHPLSSSGEVFLNLLRQWRDEKIAQKR